jgi:hypothetical protein
MGIMKQDDSGHISLRIETQDSLDMMTDMFHNNARLLADEQKLEN